MRCDLSDILKVSRVLDDDSVHIPVNGFRCRREGETACGLLSHPGIFVLMPNEGSVFAFVPYNEHLFNVHLGILPEYRGKVAIAACKDAFAWMFANTDCIKIIGLESVKHRAAIRFITSLGVDREGTLKGACYHNGVSTDMAVFGYCKPCA